MIVYDSEEDEFGTFSKIILKHYLVEGVMSSHELLFTSAQINTKKFVSNHYYFLNYVN